ncbi:MAG: hypothetical protein A3H96_03765 [Acidobacteria bacterium RIFCSPLOWO2_02_FULL_67_36]|nr:MAG: hypothetical protein A3H96_03765 [Acidobacteria bacterium RIFCSPLOWO2_02_FULL_67_36]OFW24637.1 MAG: hypothetical protein A3G21_16950 [Acidobacteria bacterium RIFCSPLOWO2_12_FULL_66_21]
MPVRKFRSVEEMSQPIWRQPGDPALYRTMAALWETGTRTSRRRYPPGVHKHRSVAEMHRVQESWAADRK